MKPNKPTQEKHEGSALCDNCGLTWSEHRPDTLDRALAMGKRICPGHAVSWFRSGLPQPTVGEQTDKCLLCGEPFEGSDWVSMDGHGVGSCVDEDYYKERIASPTPIPVGEQAKAVTLFVTVLFRPLEDPVTVVHTAIKAAEEYATFWTQRISDSRVEVVQRVETLVAEFHAVTQEALDAEEN